MEQWRTTGLNSRCRNRKDKVKNLGLDVSINVPDAGSEIRVKHRQLGQCGLPVGNQPQFLRSPPVGKSPLGRIHRHTSRHSEDWIRGGSQAIDQT